MARGNTGSYLETAVGGERVRAFVYPACRYTRATNAC